MVVADIETTPTFKYPSYLGSSKYKYSTTNIRNIKTFQLKLNAYQLKPIKDDINN